ncbi:MAG: helix-hairpin-helix domain-containing protein [Balneolaceae bacterium]|nr:helix-hairpin-helix domain-containing protein [Balneolaceae bacterium]MBO6545432.1 helix-hairpin-helix domain-containing protein [Balneolaceae bacterium]MBO6646828.1 helix-hairpin-helix domain-containing protein [Balneolaceae bacterium]
MGNSNFKREFFFWIDKLQITKQERISVTLLLGIIVLLLLANVFIKEKVVPVPENHAELLAEFERRSALIESEEQKLEARYQGREVSDTNRTESKDISPTPTELISINMASSEELQTLPGIGSSYAQRIIEYRETNGGFNSVEDLVKVRGIGEKTLEKLKPYIKL